MDGNGRWAEQHGRPRAYGHLKGARVAKKIITACVEQRVSYLTLFAFSTENWSRPSSEVSFLMALLVRFLKRELGALIRNNIQFRTIGEIERLPQAAQEMVRYATERTRMNTGMRLVFALNYGGRQEIVGAVQRISRQVAEGQLRVEEIDERIVSEALESSFLPDPDLIVRTSGECRISNFLLWQMAYSELFFTFKFWPEFSVEDLLSIFKSFSERERRFGSVLLHKTTAEEHSV